MSIHVHFERRKFLVGDKLIFLSLGSRGMTSIDENAFEEDWDQAFNINVKSHFWLMQAAKKYLDEAEGAFITTASTAGVIPSGSSLVSSLPAPSF